MIYDVGKGQTVLEFTYANQPPPVARGDRQLNTNRIRLWWDGDDLKYDRRWVGEGGKVSEISIEHTFDDTPDNRITPENVAKMIHWGCCGWSAGLHQIWQLRDLVAEFIASGRS